jgi:hypothetical protein
MNFRWERVEQVSNDALMIDSRAVGCMSAVRAFHYQHDTLALAADAAAADERCTHSLLLSRTRATCEN